MSTKPKKLLTCLIIVALLLPNFYLLRPRRAEAFFSGPATMALLVPDVDVPGNFKEFLLDILIPAIKAQMIQMITTSIVNWINSGFEGNPSFITDFKQFSTDIAIATGGALINEVEVSDNLCKPFKQGVSRALRRDLNNKVAKRSVTFKKRSACTLGDAIGRAGDITGFYANFGVGGWPAWNAIVQPQNNYIGSYLIARDELNTRIAEDKAVEQKKVDLGRGFLSWEKCYKPDGTTLKKSERGEVDHCEINTPGSVIETQLNKVLPKGLENLIEADEINEIVGALLVQLVNQILSSNGLLGTSRSSSGGPSYIDRLRDDKTTIGDSSSSYLTALLNDFINSEGQWQNAKTESLTTLLELKGVLEDLQACYQSHSNQTAADGVATRISSVNQKIQKLEAEIASSQALIDQLNQLKVQLETAKTAEEFSALTDEYQRLTLQGHNQQDVLEAQSELSSFKSQLRQAESELSRCQLSSGLTF